jgi:cytidylate kinase
MVLPKTYIKFLEPYDKELSRRIKKRGLTITVSGRAGSGKSVGSKAIAKAFDLEHVKAGKILRQMAKEQKISLVKLCKTRGKEVDYEMDRRTLKLAMKGNVVLDGRLTGWVAGNWADVKIFYECQPEVKAERVAKREKTTVKKAKEAIENRDKEDRKKYRKLYKIDYFDKSIYDIIIDNTKLTLKQAKRMPIELVREFLE